MKMPIVKQIYKRLKKGIMELEIPILKGVVKSKGIHPSEIEYLSRQVVKIPALSLLEGASPWWACGHIKEDILLRKIKKEEMKARCKKCRQIQGEVSSTCPGPVKYLIAEVK